jgi:DNA-binding NarL/FixJ family response regulator
VHHGGNHSIIEKAVGVLGSQGIPAEVASVTRLAIIDDHPIVCDGITRLLTDAAVAHEVESFPSAEGFFKVVDGGQRFDVCIVDLALPGMGGIEALREMRARWPQIPVIVLTAQSAETVAVRCFRSGASAFVSKGQDPEGLFSAIRNALHGDRTIDSRYVDLLLQAIHDPEGSLPHERLSDREFVVMCKIAAGISIQKIAQELCLSPKTVSTYRHRCLVKMGLEHNSQLTEYVIRNFDGSMPGI